MYCPNCGKEINDNAVVCIHCGCSVGKKTKPNNENARKIAQIFGPIMIIIGIVLIIIGVSVWLSMDSWDFQYDGGRKEVMGYIIGAVISIAIGIGVCVASKPFSGCSVKITKSNIALIIGIITIIIGIVLFGVSGIIGLLCQAAGIGICVASRSLKNK